MTKNSIKPIALLVHYKKTGDVGNGDSGPLQIASALQILNPNPLIHFPKSSKSKEFNNLCAIIISDNSVPRDGLQKELNHIIQYCDEQEQKPLKIFLSPQYNNWDSSFDSIKESGFLVFNQTTDALLIALTVRLHNQENKLFTREELMRVLKVNNDYGLLRLYSRVLKTELDSEGTYLGLFDSIDENISGQGSKIPLRIILKAISTAADIDYDELTRELNLDIKPRPKAELA